MARLPSFEAGSTERNTAPTGPALALEGPGCGDASFESVLCDSKGLRRHFRVKRLAAYSPLIFTIYICFKAKIALPFHRLAAAREQELRRLFEMRQRPAR